MIGELFFLIIITTVFPLFIFTQTRTEINLENNWKFNKGAHDNAYLISFNDDKWKDVTVPHDWAIYGPFDKEIDKQNVAIVQNGEEVASEKTGRTGALPHIGSAWYRNNFNIALSDKMDQRVSVENNKKVYKQIELFYFDEDGTRFSSLVEAV